MRLYVAGITLALLLIHGSSASQSTDPQRGPSTQEAAAAMSPPIINVWYGSDQRFGVIGATQRRVNILGNASHITGIRTLRYTLNGGSARTLAMGPDNRRLSQIGDFNIDLRYNELNAGSNTVTITAEANNGESALSTVVVRDQSGAVWPLPYSTSWSQLVDSAQVVDGKWSLWGGGVRIIEPGYDRMITLGDTTWTDYEVTVKVTVHGIDSSTAAWGSTSGGPGLGILMRWKGHTNTPVLPVTQPLSGYLPLGAIGWFHWRKGFGSLQPNQWEIMVPDVAVYTTNTATPLYYNVPYYFKMQVKTIAPTGPRYRFRVWRVGTTEPSTWLMTAQQTMSEPLAGSMALLAHHVSATFGEVKITPTPDGIPPVISNISSNAQSTTATITWTTDEPATSSVAYGLTTSYGSVVEDLASLVTNHSIQLQNLQPSTTYHFAVTSADWGGASDTSTDRTFQTTALTPPPAPQLVFPGNGSTGNATALTLRWNRSQTATGYRVQLGTNATFNSGVIVHDSTLTDTLRAVTGLLPGTRYYWRVSARNSGGEGLFSSVSTFVTLLDVPLLEAPANGAVNISPSPALSWFRVPSATSYRVRVAVDSTFGGTPALDDSSVVDTTREARGLEVGQKYYWRVQARTSQATSNFSVAWAFTPGLGSPTLLSPANGSSNQSVNSTFRWTRVPLATAYDLQIGTNIDFTSGVFFESSIPDTSRGVSGLAAGTQYYWRVRSRNAAGPGPYSQAWPFSTGLAAAQLLRPDSGSVDQPLTIQFEWKRVTSATGYAFQLATDPTFATGIVKNDTSIADTFRVVYGLLNGTTYYWHVRARQGSAYGAFSPTWRFKTLPRLPEAVTLIELADGVSDVSSSNVRFIWRHAQPSVDRYWFELAMDPQFSLTSIDSNVTDSTTVVASLLDGTRYYWRVRAGNTDGWGPFSQARTFHVGPLDVRLLDSGVPTTFALEQNYPNPFNPVTGIRFQLPGASHVRLSVYDLLGREVAVLVDDRVGPGRYQVSFDGGGLSSGVYIYRLVAGSDIESRRMLLTK